MILRSTATAFVRHPLALAVLFGRINRVQVTPSTPLYSSARDCGVPASEVSFRMEARMLLLQRLFRDNGVSYDLQITSYVLLLFCST
jgi:hypothetical protein